MIVIGIDYSVNCPSICCLETEPITAKWFVNYRKLDGKPYPELGHEFNLTRSTTEDEIDRFIELRVWVMDHLYAIIPDMIVIEDYSFNAKGRVTQLAENTGILKAALREGFPTTPVHLVAPTSMKKFATTKGNADKDMIWESFVKVFPSYANHPGLCHPKAKKVGSPLADIADSYFLAQYGRSFFIPAI